MPRTKLPKHLETQASPRKAQFRPKQFRFSLSYFLGALILNILISPFVDPLSGGDLIETMLTTLVLLVAVLSIAGRWRALVGIVLVAPAVVGQWLNHWWPDEMLVYVVTRAAGLLFIGFVVVELLRFIVSAPRVDAEVLCAAVAGFLLSGLAWSLAYDLLDRLDPNSFVFTLGSKSGHSMNGFTSLYFSFITLSTVGYGDIVPAAEVARMLAMVEAMFGMFYMALLISRLVSLYSSKTPPEIVSHEGIANTKGVESEKSQTGDQA
ncbi:MAG: two pore domain potassium channel family protein [Verrucomicrobia bacterium]|nr:two pore domain potassium channel family protein [Verrucomicrobiota bacterium]